MGRSHRIQYEYAWYHVYNRGVDHSDIFLDDHDYLQFLSLLDKVSYQFCIETHIYCLMKNHYHLAICTPLGNLSQALHSLTCQYAIYFNQRYSRDGPLFKSRFQSKLIENDAYLLQLCSYIHANPVKDKFVADLADYRWSSFHAYTKGKCDLETISCDKIIGILNTTNYKTTFKQFILQTNYPLKLPYKDQIDIENIISIDSIIKYICIKYDVSKSHITTNSQGKQNASRKMAITLARVICHASYQEISTAFGGVSHAQISRIIKQTQVEISFSDLVQELKKTLT